MRKEITQKEYKMSVECLKKQIGTIKKLMRELKNTEDLDEEQILKEELTREQDYYE